MVNDGAVAAAKRPTLHPVGGEGYGFLASQLAQTDPFESDMQSGAVHHGEHIGQALVFFTNQIADSAFPIFAIGHGAGSAAVDAHLVFQRDGAQVITLAGSVVLVEQKLRRQEHGNAMHALGRAFDPCEHQVNDVLGHPMVTPGDENLLTENAVVIALGHRASADGGEVGAGLGFGHVHGAGPLAADQVFQKTRLQFLIAVQLERFGGAHAKYRAN